MIIDSSVYSGKCSCGRDHTMETKLAVVESGVLRRFDQYMQQYGLSGFRTAVYDTNTYHAEGLTRPKADFEAVLDAHDLHGNEHGVAALRAVLPAETKVLIAVGSGTIHDITRYVAWELGLAFVSCPTAASVDGFCSSVAAMTWEGAKKTLTAVPPSIVLADLDVITKAPIRLARSGFGDMIGKFIALTDWKIGHILTGEFYCDRIADMTMEATRAVMESAKGIASGDAAAYEMLTYGLILSGLAMQLMGNSRPASGAEHHISHIIEMEPDSYGVHSDGLHGEKVGVGTLLAVEEYHRLAALQPSCWGDYRTISENEIFAVFGDRLSRQIGEENAKDAATGVTGERIQACMKDIQTVIAAIPTAEELAKVYARLGVMHTLEEIQVPDTLREKLLNDSPMVRNRLTLMRLRRCLK